MANNKRVIRKITTPNQRVIDEQFWPVILALFVLCGFLMGTVAAYLPFGARWWWQDATIWLFAIPIATCALVWMLRHVPSRVVRRVLQISVVLCLLVHIVLLIVSVESRIFNRLWEQNNRTQASLPRRQQRIVNSYLPHQLDQRQRQQQEFVKPVETAVPEPVQEQVERQEERPEQPQAQPMPMPAPQTQRDIQRNPIERQTPAETRPRQSEQASRLSRQLAETKPQPGQAISTPTIAAPAAQSSSLEARSDSLRQRATEAQADRVQTTAEPATISRDSPMVARRAAESAPTTETRSAPTLPRQLAQPTTIPRVDLRTGENPSIARQTSPSELEPARTTARQQVTASPREALVAEPNSVPRPDIAATSAPRREQPSPLQPQIAQSPISAANRQPRTTSRPDAISAASTVAANAQPVAPGSQNLEASSSTVARSAATSNASPTAAAATASQATVSASTAIARQSAPNAPTTSTSVATPTPRSANIARAANQPAAVSVPSGASTAETTASLSLGGGPTGLQRQLSSMSAAGATAGPTTAATPAAAPSIAMSSERAQGTNEASAAPGTSSTNHLARTARAAQIATSTTLSETPRTVTADAGADGPQARPSRLAMTQSLGGVAGVGQTPNLGRSPSTPGSPSSTASGAARRAEASQNTPAGPALAPSATSLARRSLVGSDLPSASLRATTTSVADAAGAEQPGELNASSGASLTQQSANATQGNVTAAKGNVDIDLGPTRIADAGGFERPSGGGLPEVNVDNDVASPARSRSGGSAALALSTTAVDISAASPQASDQAAAGELAAGGTAMQRNETASASGAFAAKPDRDPGSGTNANTGEQIAASALTRSEKSADAPAIGESGTGTAAEEDEEKRRLARATSNSGPAGSLAGPATGATSVVESNASSADATFNAQEILSGGIARQLPVGSGGPTGAAEEIASAAVAAGGNLIGESTLQRTESVDGLAGPALPGGGTATPQRAASTREFGANVTADVMSLAGAPASSGSPQGSDVAALGGTPSSTENGAIGRPVNTPVGAIASDMARDAAPQAGTDSLAGPAQRSPVSAAEPSVGDSSASAARLARSGKTQFNASPAVAAVSGVPSMPTSVATEGAELTEAAMGTASTKATQQTAAALPIDVLAIDDLGGLGDRLALDVGVNSRLASPESVAVQTTPSRFERQEVGGAPELNTSAVFATDAFRSRAPGRGESSMRGGTGSAGPQTEEAVELGLSFLARRQLPDGSWTLNSTTEPVQLASDTAATGLCLLAFQGAGYSHREHKYAARISAALDYLVKNQKPDGDLFVPLDDISNRSVWLYSHGIAAIALCEAYGMTHDPKLREPAQKALEFIAATQDPKGGGWRYQPGVESDTSVTGWMMMALKSGELAGLTVPRTTYDHIGRWLDVAQGSAEERYLYRYNPFAPNTATQRHGRSTSSTMTAVGLLMRLYGGWRRDHPAMMEGAEHLLRNLPSIGSIREPLRDTYYWYYGTQVMFHMGGRYWEEWNGRLHPLLIESQLQQGELAGSWSPTSPLPDRWAPHAGRLYVTTMNLLSLEVTYRHLPLYVDTAK